MEEKKPCLSCVDCRVYHCHYQNSKYPEFCLTTNMNSDTYKRALDALKSEEDNRIAVAAAQVEAYDQVIVPVLGNKEMSVTVTVAQ